MHGERAQSSSHTPSPWHKAPGASFLLSDEDYDLMECFVNVNVGVYYMYYI